MKYAQYALMGLGALALVAFIILAVFGAVYLGEKANALKIENNAAERKAKLFEPSISTEGISCDITEDAKAQNYSLTVRVRGADIPATQREIVGKIESLGGQVSSKNDYKTQDPDAGYSTSGFIDAIIPLDKTDAFASHIKNSVSTPEYYENESVYVRNAAILKETCTRELDYLKNAAASESLYLGQLFAGQQSGQPLDGSAIDASSSVTKDLEDVRINASNSRSYIDQLMSDIGKTRLYIDIRVIPG